MDLVKQIRKDVTRTVTKHVNGVLLSIGYWNEVHRLLNSKYDIGIVIDERGTWHVTSPMGAHFEYHTFGEAIVRVLQFVEQHKLRVDTPTRRVDEAAQS